MGITRSLCALLDRADARQLAEEFLAEQSEHGQVAHVFGDGGYVWNWARTTLENWQSEMLQVFVMVVLTSFLIFKGSPESRDGDDE